ncbi:FAD-dependent oxidoreductase [Parasutterella excrementihominis]|jgi:fumarate reductase flavoprotein subunit|uniref:FAD-dependent oxidoreductase n=1 Tax=Parasutterella excrementihominis TaxID=487175 RepID=UPI00242EF8B5|nr:FAD-dependent oxidoreductase [Parasutterella excrementihominis]MCI9301644.1 FAD-dependent oxidoreductase [Parasutterella excrementihominis]
MTGINRRGLLKGSIFGMAAAGASVIPVAVQAQAAAPVKTEEYDVVVIGCGCAGMAAALEAADKGAKVVILEKMPRPAGNTIFAGGHFNATNTYVQKAQGLQDTIDDFYRDMMIVSQQRGDKALTRQYCEMSGSAIQWLTDECGVKFKPIVVEVFPGLNRGHVVDGKLKPGGAQLSKQMLDTVKAKKIPVLFNTKVISLIGDNRLHVLGCRAVNEDDEAVDFMAKGGVVICTGGFHANKEMVCRYMGGDVAWMPIRGSNVLQGENITLTMPFNPKYVNMDQFHAGPIHGPTRANPSTMVNYGVLLKEDGTRFLDEAETYVSVAQKMPKIIPNNWAFIIIDSQVVDVPTVKARIDRYKRAKAPIYTGNTIEEMAKAANLPVEQVVSVIKEYNDAVKAGKANTLTPPNTLEKPRLIEKGPFMAFPFQGGMTATFGGPMITAKSEVLNNDDKPIPGLYAAGNALGGIFYHDYIVGSQLTAAVIWGRIAGEQAAARAGAKQG